jgi:hypothetical protein
LVVFVVDVAGPQASDDIPVPFAVLVPVSVVVVEVDSSGRPKFLAFSNVDRYASYSSSVEGVGEGFVHSSTGAHTNYGLCSILSNLGLHQNRNLGHYDNNPNPGHNNGSDTNDLPMDATTNHSRKICLHHLYQEQRRHRPYQASLRQLVVRQIRWVVAKEFQYVYLPLPSLEWERQLPTPKAVFRKVTSSFCCLPSPMPSRLEDNSLLELTEMAFIKEG